MSQFSDNRRPGFLGPEQEARSETPEGTFDEKPFRLAKSFSTVAIVLIFGTVLTLATVVSRQAEIIITKRVEDDTIKLMDNLNHQMYERFLREAFVRFGEISLRKPVQREMLHEVISNTIYGFDIKRVMIYDAKDERVTFSTDETMLGSRPDDQESYDEAIKAYIPSRVNPWRWRLGSLEGPTDSFQLFLKHYQLEPARPDERWLAKGPLSPREQSLESLYYEWLWERATENNSVLLSPTSPLTGRLQTETPPTSPQIGPEEQNEEEAYLENLRAQTVFRYEGGQYLFFNFFPSGDFVLRGYKAMEFYETRKLSGVLEISRDLTPEFRQIAKLQYFALSMAALLALLLSTILRWVVSRGESILTKRNLERQALRERLDQAERLAGLGSMVATVAHEIRNPLGIIHSTADVLNRFLAPDPDKARLARAIVEEANRLSEVVTEFLDFARPPTPRPAPVVVEEILEEILAFLEVTLSRAGVELRCDFRDDPTPIMGDGPMLHRAFLNILANAIQAMEDGGLIWVRTSLEKDDRESRLLVAISDTGPGLSDEMAKKLFSPFYTTKAKGTGLGLVIVRNIIEGHGGTIEMKNGPAPAANDEGGPGWTVEIRLPANLPE